MHKGLAALMLLFPALAWAAEGGRWVDGVYSSPELGLLEFRSEGGRLSGKYQGGGACDFLPDQQIIDGQFEGNVMVGSVMLCQTGAACKQRAYPFLAFFNPWETTLSAEIKLDAGCDSPGLKGSRLVLSIATAEERAPGRVGGSASLVAKKKSNPAKSQLLAKQAVAAGAALLTSGDYAAAEQQFEAAISYNEKNWTAYLGLGVAQLKSGNVLKAIDSYERARDLAREAREENTDIYYNLACAFARRGDKKTAVANLKLAVKMGFSLPEQMSSDPDLASVRDDPEFKRLVNQARAQEKKGGRRGKP